jgi:hypothetical protein
MKNRTTAEIRDVDRYTLHRICEALNAQARPRHKGDAPHHIYYRGTASPDVHIIEAPTKTLIARAKDAALGARIARAVIEENRNGRLEPAISSRRFDRITREIGNDA